MPNWCFSTLTVSGPKNAVEKFRDTATGPGPADDPEVLGMGMVVPFSMNQMYPVPHSSRHDPAALKQWQIDHWGCRAGAYNVTVEELPGQVTYHFETPWSPPIGLIHKLSSWYPSLKFTWSYEIDGEQNEVCLN